MLFMRDKTLHNLARKVPNGNWEIEWLAGEGKVFGSGFRDFWHSLYQGDHEAKIFQNPDVVHCWWQCRGARLGKDIEICIGRLGEYTVITPFLRRGRTARNIWLRRLEGFGEPNFDYQIPLGFIPDPSMLCGYWQALFVSLSGRCVDSCWLRRVPTAYSNPAWELDNGLVSPIVDLRAFSTWSDFEKSLSPNLRTDVRRRKRRVAEMGPVSLLVYGKQDVSDAKKAVEEMFDAHAQQWQGTPSETYFESPGIKEFYKELIDRLLPQGLLHFSRLMIDGSVAAWHFGFLHRQSLHWYKPVYSHDHAHLSPGKLILAYLVEQGIEEKWKEIDLGVGNEFYKQAWMNTSCELRQYEWRSRSVVNRLRYMVKKLGRYESLFK